MDRYQVRLLAFCRGMLSSAEDAEDILQEVFVAAHKAILADNRAINARPWLYRIARNRCLNHLRKPVPEGQDSMDEHPYENGTSVAEKVQRRAEFRALIMDVKGLPETQRSALLLREIDALSYEEIAVAMDTTVPAVKSLLVRARMSLADASQGRHLTCDEVHLELAEAAEGIRKVSSPVRFHLKDCDRCRAYRSELRQNGKALAALVPVGPLAAFAHSLFAKLGIGGANAGAGSSAAAGAGGSAAGSAVAASGGGSAVGLAGSGAAGLGGAALGTKAAAGVASMALLTAGAVEVRHLTSSEAPPPTAAIEQETIAMADPVERSMGPADQTGAPATPNRAQAASDDEAPPAEAPVVEAPAEPAPAPEPAPPPAPAPSADAPAADAATGSAQSGTGEAPPSQGSSGGVTAPEPPVEGPADPASPPAPPDGDGFVPVPGP